LRGLTRPSLLSNVPSMSIAIIRGGMSSRVGDFGWKGLGSGFWVWARYRFSGFFRYWVKGGEVG
jgi:hypothetical protein